MLFSWIGFDHRLLAAFLVFLMDFDSWGEALERTHFIVLMKKF
jgi:hypothetical protein